MTQAAAAIRLPPAYRLVALDAAGSTNDEARTLARDGAADGTIVWARTQSAGRGRQGREWSSPPGNLYMSLVLRPDCPPREAVQLAFVAALGAGGMIGPHARPAAPLRFKWPNDILLGARKVAGILLEAEGQGERLDFMILGLGVNLVSHPANARIPATDIREATGETLAPEAALEGFARHFMDWVTRWHEGGFAPVREAWIAHAAGLGERIEVRLPAETTHGTFAGLDGHGALLLDTAQGRRTIAAGDVHLAGT
ncbi:MAG: biotin--[acetyl-CoA-carboxylase] ligase [Rhodospirillales bacterium]|nr:biotin--[acetyl-CoA-carboxylase] ligase [Rhodospirillales bacterium]